MELWLDTIDFDLIEKTVTQLNITGITTNPSILAGSALSAKNTITKLLQIQPGKLAVQVTASTHRDMITQAKMLAVLDPRIIIKIPVNSEGLIAIKSLSALNIQTMATAVFEPRQVLLSAMAGATYAAPYFGRIVGDNYAVLNDMLSLVKTYNYPLKLIVAAIRNKDQIVNIAQSGAHAITVPADPFHDFISDLNLTTESLDNFAKDWDASGKSLNV